jgi:hypothetical protein
MLYGLQVYATADASEATELRLRLLATGGDRPVGLGPNERLLITSVTLTGRGNLPAEAVLLEQAGERFVPVGEPLAVPPRGIKVHGCHQLPHWRPAGCRWPASAAPARCWSSAWSRAPRTSAAGGAPGG